MGIHWPTQFILNISHVVDIEIGRHSFQKICMAFVKKKKKKKPFDGRVTSYFMAIRTWDLVA